MRITIFLAHCLLIFLLSSCSKEKESTVQHAKMPTEELQALDETIKKDEEYKRMHHATIDSLIRILHAMPVDDHVGRTDLYIKIADKMVISQADSALEFSNHALIAAYASNNDSLINEAELSRMHSLVRAGIFSKAEDQMREIGSRPLSPKQRLRYYRSARYMYSYMRYYVIDNYEISQGYAALSKAYDDSLLSVLPKNDISYKFIESERLVDAGNNRKAKQQLDSLIRNPQNSEYFGRLYYQRALVHKNLGDETKYAADLARAAQCDIKECVGEGLALIKLAEWLYKQGNVEEAFLYINFATEQATIANARMRAVNIAALIPFIDETYREQIAKSNAQLWFWLYMSLAMLVTVLIFIILLLHQRAKAKHNRRAIKAMTKIQERHLANFLALCSTYYHKLNHLSQLVRRKIASGQTDELQKILKSGRFAEDEAEDIFEIFDRSFLELYPDFIEKINTLLRPEEQFTPRSDGRLPIELRIYALVKLGIPESTRIAQILNYSVNTVYAYRNKMRNKAADRENFEDDIQKLTNTTDEFED